MTTSSSFSSSENQNNKNQHANNHFIINNNPCKHPPLNKLLKHDGNNNDGSPNPPNNKNRVTYKQLCQAAGGSSLSKLEDAMASGWTAYDIDTMVAGKSALHMAAWKGCLENVQYLIETVGCNVNAYSIAEFSYGKTAIFFAATQSRVDIVNYLLTVPNIKVTIVNNKGQSVLSICASHDMPQATLERIQELIAKDEEEEQTKQSEAKNNIDNDDDGDNKGLSCWWNFRKTHSDGLEYGDLEPKFLDRPLRPTDIVTPLAINPTNKESRKGAFQRRNQEFVKTHQQQQQQKAISLKDNNSNNENDNQGMKKQQKKKKRQERPTTAQALEAIQNHSSWETIQQSMSCINHENTKMVSMEQKEETNRLAVSSNVLIQLVKESDQYKCAWISFVAIKLVDLLGQESAAKVIHQAITMLHTSDTNIDATSSSSESDKQGNTNHHRIIVLLEKLQTQIGGQGATTKDTQTANNTDDSHNDISSSNNNNNHKNDKNQTNKKKSINRNKFLPSLDPWKVTCEKLVSSNLNMSIFLPSLPSSSLSLSFSSNLDKDHKRQQLRLPQTPIFVNTREQFMKMQQEVLDNNTTRIVAIDTEWYDKDEKLSLDSNNNKDDDSNNNNNNKIDSDIFTDIDVNGNSGKSGSSRNDGSGNDTSTNRIKVDISTIQVSILQQQQNCHQSDDKEKERNQNYQIVTYVVDLMDIDGGGGGESTNNSNNDSTGYHLEAQEWVRRLMEDENTLILGFAIGNDIPHLERFCSQKLLCQAVLDLQQFLLFLTFNDDLSSVLPWKSSYPIKTHSKDQKLSPALSSSSSPSSLPGLKACVEQFTEIPLSKEEQCSNWAQRPLTSAQIEYAGMDAAVLFVLFTEYLRNQQHKEE